MPVFFYFKYQRRIAAWNFACMRTGRFNSTFIQNKNAPAWGV